MIRRLIDLQKKLSNIIYGDMTSAELFFLRSLVGLQH